MLRLVLLGTAVLATAAAAQTPQIPESAYRRDQAEVLAPAPDPSAGPLFDAASFRRAYARAGRPTIAVLWNREFSDMLEQGSASQVNISSARLAAGSADVVRVPGAASADVVGASVRSTTITAGEVKTRQARRQGPVEHADLELRSAFLQTMTSSGVRVVDRNVVMRTTAAKAKSGSRDSQQVETEALSRHAKLVMEVLNTRDPAAATGWSTYVSIKRLSDGVVLAEGYMNGHAPEGAPARTPRFVAEPAGGFREAPRSVTEVGRLIAEQTLARLAGAL